MVESTTDTPLTAAEEAAAELLEPTVIQRPAQLSVLRPGETHVRLKKDPYYGYVDLGPKSEEGEPDPPVTVEEVLEVLKAQIEDGVTVLTGEQQTRVEVLTGKRLQALDLEPREPEPIEPEVPEVPEGLAKRPSAPGPTKPQAPVQGRPPLTPPKPAPPTPKS